MRILSRRISISKGVEEGKNHGILEGQQREHLTEGMGHKRQGCLGGYISSKRKIDIHRTEKVTISLMILSPRDNYLAMLPSNFFPMQNFLYNENI